MEFNARLIIDEGFSQDVQKQDNLCLIFYSKFRQLLQCVYKANENKGLSHLTLSSDLPVNYGLSGKAKSTTYGMKCS